MYGVQLKHRKAKVPVLKDCPGHSILQGLQQLWNIFSQEFLRTEQIVTGSLGVSPELQLFPLQLIVLVPSNYLRAKISPKCSQLTNHRKSIPSILILWSPNWFSPSIFLYQLCRTFKVCQEIPARSKSDSSIVERTTIFKQTNQPQTTKSPQKTTTTNLYRSFWNTINQGFSLKPAG